jgi:hypothetical protein
MMRLVRDSASVVSGMRKVCFVFCMCAVLAAYRESRAGHRDRTSRFRRVPYYGPVPVPLKLSSAIWTGR